MRNDDWNQNRSQDRMRSESESRRTGRFGGDRRFRESDYDEHRSRSGERDYASEGRFDYADDRREPTRDWRMDQSHYMGGSLDQGRLDYGRGRDYSDRAYESYGYQQGDAGGWRGSDHSWNERAYFDRDRNRLANGENRGVWESVKGFFGIGPKGYKRSDERIREDACETLARHPGVDASDIEVSVESATVVLRGTVPNRWMKRQAEDAIDSISGVDDVRNEIQVKRESREFGGPTESTRDREREELETETLKSTGMGVTKNSLI